ncbi:conserved hypothetical protein [Microsporum canis CBS 113480]|uniref:Glutamine amidotransferase domain-containing protein n=1 Tax=Arthroderma otae (strain ATCC MYA-4605 / CBS 113480) TaxID=554155 RepID=C5G0X9_ARTOC|nr:conserved hypothetical protein [Microsporum canis CBS 113480]EEQ35782.1 conserved hypothetical protein [Microsporum canis CBS 113480]
MSSIRPRVAVIQNYSSAEQGGGRMIENISRLVRCSKPNAEIHVYAPIDGEPFPDLYGYGLVILTGGPFSLLQDEKPSWVTETLDFIRHASTHPAKPKLLGICWGHQAAALALGGSVEELKTGPCNIHKNHRLAVVDAGPRLSRLAANHEILTSEDGQIVTLQGHPELDAALSQLFVHADGLSCSLLPGLKGIHAPHDGEAIFASIMRWAISTSDEIS